MNRRRRSRLAPLFEQQLKRARGPARRLVTPTAKRGKRAFRRNDRGRCGADRDDSRDGPAPIRHLDFAARLDGAEVLR